MPVSTIGTTPEWGVGSAQTGIIIDSQEEAWSASERFSLSRVGEEQGVIVYNAKCEITLTGEVPTSTPFSVRLAAAVTLGNALTAFGNGSLAVPSSTSLYNRGVRKSIAREGFQTFSITVAGQPNFA